MQGSTEVTIHLEKGATFRGRGFGDFSKPRGAEFVFSTAMSGIEESLTDPSFARQALVCTVSHIGNTGFTDEDQESAKIWAEGLVCRWLEDVPSNWRSCGTLGSWILSQGRFVVEGVDTRALTMTLRDQGSQRGVVVADAVGLRDGRGSVVNLNSLIEQNCAKMSGLNLADLVSEKGPADFWGSAKSSAEAYWPWKQLLAGSEQSVAMRPSIVVWDFGVKTNTLRILDHCGARVRVVSTSAKAEDILSLNPKGLLLSNGPGDPAACGHIVQELKKLVGKLPIFGICLGHQLLAIAIGAKTFKMPFGHRGIHHPVKELPSAGLSGRTWITSQNHGFAVDGETLPRNARVTHVHADDGSVEGFDVLEHRIQSVQFHPESAPGPMDTSFLIAKFLSGVSAS